MNYGCISRCHQIGSNSFTDLSEKGRKWLQEVKRLRRTFDGTQNSPYLRKLSVLSVSSVLFSPYKTAVLGKTLGKLSPHKTSHVQKIVFSSSHVFVTIYGIAREYYTNTGGVGNNSRTRSSLVDFDRNYFCCYIFHFVTLVVTTGVDQ